MSKPGDPDGDLDDEFDDDLDDQFDDDLDDQFDDDLDDDDLDADGEFYDGRDPVVIRATQANLQLGALSRVDGRLILTPEALKFVMYDVEWHGSNPPFGSHVEVIPLPTVESLTVRWTKLAKLIPVAPTSLWVRTIYGVEHEFVVLRAKVWKQAIEQAMTGGLVQ